VSATREEVLKWFLAQVGTTESPPGSNQTKYGREFGLDGFAWCAMFVWVGFNRFDVPIIKSAFTPTMADWFADQKRGFTDDRRAQRGDVVFFNFPDSLDRIQHVGIVLANENGQLRTIEGNTSPSDAGSQDNGGGVFKRTRPYSFAVYYGRPAYGERLPRFDLPKNRTWFGPGDKGADVRNWQRHLNGWMRHLREHRKDLAFDFGKVDVDGHFGRNTLKATQQFQHDVGLDVDGRVGKHTIAKMEAIRARQKT
jgi:hypothetical protein